MFLERQGLSKKPNPWTRSMPKGKAGCRSLKHMSVSHFQWTYHLNDMHHTKHHTRHAKISSTCGKSPARRLATTKQNSWSLHILWHLMPTIRLYIILIYNYLHIFEKLHALEEAWVSNFQNQQNVSRHENFRSMDSSELFASGPQNKVVVISSLWSWEKHH